MYVVLSLCLWAIFRLPSFVVVLGQGVWREGVETRFIHVLWHSLDAEGDWN